eukprot:TRINITY_DN8828_c0_g1_i11.p1 TRINITY_DN8828_c0_g1~~TRINITY_DN8828_c0_g1_i11.p1  ORF type:complete len:324 (-),score=74.67 TRINITY_DN8828_c0_g1_i11:213-1184(-)
METRLFISLYLALGVCECLLDLSQTDVDQIGAEFKIEDLFTAVQSIDELFAAVVNGSGIALETIATAISQQGVSGADAFVDALTRGGNGSSDAGADVFRVLVEREDSQSASATLTALSDRQLMDVITKALIAAADTGFIQVLASALADALQQGDTVTLVDASTEAIIQGEHVVISEAILEAIQNNNLEVAAFALARILANNVDFAEFVAQFIQTAIQNDNCDQLALVISQAQNFAVDGTELIDNFQQNSNFDDCLLQPVVRAECPIAQCFDLDNCCAVKTDFKMGDICDADIGQKNYKFAGECDKGNMVLKVWNPEFGFACYC